MFPNNPVLKDVGLNSYSWTASSNTFDQVAYATAHYLHFNGYEVYPSLGLYDRWRGYPIRYQTLY